MQRRTRDVALGTVIAAGLGYVVGIMAAPKTGRQTRRDLQQAALRAKGEAERKLKKVHREVDTLIDQASVKTKAAKAARKRELETAIAQATEAKRKVRELLTALHEGDSVDSDLDKAVKDAKTSIKHLKTYLVKHGPETSR